MSFGSREPAWRRREADRARQQREAHEARRRQALGLAPAEPIRGRSAIAGIIDQVSQHSVTTAATTSAFLNYTTQLNSWNNIYRHYEIGTASRSTLNNAIGIATAEDNATAKKMTPDEPVEREPTLREVWAD